MLDLARIMVGQTMYDKIQETELGRCTVRKDALQHALKTIDWVLYTFTYCLIGSLQRWHSHLFLRITNDFMVHKIVSFNMVTMKAALGK